MDHPMSLLLGIVMSVDTYVSCSQFLEQIFFPTNVYKVIWSFYCCKQFFSVIKKVNWELPRFSENICIIFLLWLKSDWGNMAPLALSDVSVVSIKSSLKLGCGLNVRVAILFFYVSKSSMPPNSTVFFSYYFFCTLEEFAHSPGFSAKWTIKSPQ